MKLDVRSLRIHNARLERSLDQLREKTRKLEEENNRLKQENNGLKKEQGALITVLPFLTTVISSILITKTRRKKADRQAILIPTVNQMKITAPTQKKNICQNLRYMRR